jgi:hypothetical protein
MYKCLECSREFVKPEGLSKHINLNHGSCEEYYKKWLKENNEGNCKICGNTTEFRNLTHGYKNVCSSKECLNKFKYIKLKEGMLKKYSTHASVYVEEIKNKQINTCIDKYGVSNPLSSEKIQNKIRKTNIKKYGFANCLSSPEIRNKIEETNLKKYGVRNAAQNPAVKLKIKNSMMRNHGVESYLSKKKEKKDGMIKKYGVEYAQQNKEIHTKQQISSCKLKKYQDSNIYYRGKYELDFLEKYLIQYPDIINGPSIKYMYKSKNRIYHSDFYIPSKNLIVEIKNSYLYNRDKNIIKAKEKACIENGYYYIIIIDKDYSSFRN